MSTLNSVGRALFVCRSQERYGCIVDSFGFVSVASWSVWPSSGFDFVNFPQEILTFCYAHILWSLSIFHFCCISTGNTNILLGDLMVTSPYMGRTSQGPVWFATLPPIKKLTLPSKRKPPLVRSS